MKAHPKGGNTLAVAEVNGAEIYPEIERYISAGSNTSIYSWTGCTIHITGNTVKEYLSRAPFMVPYLNIASVLEQRRVSALSEHRIGPRTLVLGSPYSGKSTLCHILANYGIRGGWAPSLINLDPRGSSDRPFHMCPPGVIGASMLFAADESKESSATLWLPAGGSDWQKDPSVFLSQCATLSMALSARLRVAAAAERIRVDAVRKQRLSAIAAGVLQANAPNKQAETHPPGEGGIVAASGSIIDGPNACSPEFAIELIRAFGCECVIVLDQNPLCASIETMLRQQQINNVAIVSLPRSDGVVPYNLEKRLVYNLERLASPPLPIRRSTVGMAAGLLPPPPVPRLAGSFVIEKELLPIEFTFLGIPFPSNASLLVEMAIVETRDQYDPTAEPSHALAVKDFSGDIRSLLDVPLLVSLAQHPSDVPKAGIAGVALVVGMEPPGVEKMHEDGSVEVTTSARLTLRTSISCFAQTSGAPQPKILVPVTDLPPVFKVNEVLERHKKMLEERSAQETQFQPPNAGRRRIERDYGGYNR